MISQIKWLNIEHSALSYLDETGLENCVSLPTEAEPQKSVCEEIINGLHGPIEEYTPEPSVQQN